MKTSKKVLSVLLIVLMFIGVTIFGFGTEANAATTINYSPNPKVEYNYSSGVTVGTIRYTAQNRTSSYFSWNYWPTNSFGGYTGGPESECGTACISMALSYVGVNRTPKELLQSTNGWTGQMWGQQGNATSRAISKSTTAISNAMNDYINGNGKYSPLCVYIQPFSSSSKEHWVILIGRISNNKYLALNPWHGSGNATFEIQMNGTTATYYAGTNPVTSINQWYNPNASIASPEPTKIIYPTSGSVYKIASAVGSGKYLDFALSSNNVQIYENCDNHSNPDFVKSQYFKLTHVGDGWYTIVNTGNGKAVDVIGANSASGTNIQQHVINNTNAQLFRFYDAGNGYCYIKSKVGTYVDAEGGINANNVNVWAYEFNGTVAQKWKLQSHSHSYTSKITANATCTKEGSKTNTCKCGVTTTETIAKKGHSYTSTITTQPTCTNDGVKTFKCSCGASYTEKIAKKAHSYTSTVTTQPTCAKEGVKTFKCSCGASYTQAVAKVAHSYTSVNVSASKDQPAGKKFTCSVCGYSYFQKNEKTWSEWSTTYPTGVDEKYIESKKEYRYSDYQTTTSYNSSVSGYSYLNSTWEKEGSYIRKYVPSWPSGYPTTSDFYKTYNKSRVSSSETSTEKIVANEPKVYKYIYYHWCRGTYTGGPINRTTKKAKTGEFCKYHAFISDVNPNTLTCADDGSRIIGRESLCKDTYWYYPVTMYSQTYTKYKKLNTFYRWTDFSSWSSTAYTASSTRKVETRTLYRYVTYDPDAYVEESKPLGTTSNIAVSQTSSSVTLNWNAVEGAAGYRVYQKKSGEWKAIANITKLTYTINNLKANTKYDFAVRAYKLDGETKVLAPKYKSVSATTSKMALGTTSKITASVTSSSVTLDWNAIEGADGYRVYQKLNSKWTALGYTTSLTYKVKSLKANTKYDFAVRAYKLDGETKVLAPKYKSASVTTSKATTLAQVKNLKATVYTETVNLSWSKVSNATGYEVLLYNSSTKKYTSIGKVTKTSCKVKNLTPGTVYQFAVRAYNSTGNGKISAIVKITTKLATPVVTISSTKTKAHLSWADIKGESGYAIYMATSKNGKYTHLANYKANSTKATKSNLKSGKTYYFKIRAYKKNSSGTVYGAYSAVKSVKIK